MGKGGGQNKRRGLEIFVKFNKWGVKINAGAAGVGAAGVRISKYLVISVMNEKRDKCLILMLNLKVSKQTRSEASKNKVIIKRVLNISID